MRHCVLCYNAICMGSHVFIQRFILAVAAVALLHPGTLCAQQSATHRAAPAIGSQIYLVFPFENAGASSRLDWLGEGLEELTILRLSAAGDPLTRTPAASTNSTATDYRLSAKPIAPPCCALRKIWTSTTFCSAASPLTAPRRRANRASVRVNPPSLLPVIRESGPLDSLMDLQTKLAWRTLSSSNRSYPFSLTEFAKKQRPLRLDAFEHYVRGLLANEDEVRLRELKEAARLEPIGPNRISGSAKFIFPAAIAIRLALVCPHSQTARSLRGSGVRHRRLPLAFEPAGSRRRSFYFTARILARKCRRRSQ